jgi:hypothetical protein
VIFVAINRKTLFWHGCILVGHIEKLTTSIKVFLNSRKRLFMINMDSNVQL